MSQLSLLSMNGYQISFMIKCFFVFFYIYASIQSLVCIGVLVRLVTNGVINAKVLWAECLFVCK